MIKRRTIFRRLLSVVILACVLTAALSGVIYSVTGVRMLARRIADEMMPRAEAISRLATRYVNGQITFDSFVDFAVREQQGARIYIFDGQGNTVAYSDTRDASSSLAYLQTLLPSIFADGESVVSTKWRTSAGIVVGVPILDNLGRVNGAIFITRPRSEVGAAMRSLFFSLTASCAAAVSTLIPLAFIATRRIAKPVRQMTDVAISMANGDFSSRAGEFDTQELVLLGGALNHLSGALFTTIQDLRLAKDRLHTILQGLAEGVVAIDSSGRVTYYNDAAAKLLGCPADGGDVLGCLAEALPVYRSAIAGKKAAAQLSRGESTLLVTATPSKETADSGAGAVVLLQDVSEYERLEQTRRDYVANVSHELRTPISSIRSLAEALNDGLVKTDEDRARYYGYILRESLRLSRLINDLLELSRLQSGTVSIEKDAFDLDALLFEVTERMRLSASYSGISLRYTCAALPKAFSNRDRIEQVLVSLIDNAIKYADDDGAVTVEAEQAADKLLVRVRDTGRIAEKDLPHLFERFYKADVSHSEGGTGLGLAITQEILTRLGESIAARNEGNEAILEFTVAAADRGAA